MIYRLDPDDAFRQGLWIVIGVGLFALTLLALRRDYRVLESYKYLFGIGAIVLLMLPALPGIGQTINGARLWVKVGAFQFQPGELAKIFLIVFLAGYLREKREVLAQGRLKDFGPLLLIWGAAMLVLVQTNDLGSALLQFGIFLAMLYVATGRAPSSPPGSRSSSAAPRSSTTTSATSRSASRSGCTRGRTSRSSAPRPASSRSARTAARSSSSRASTRSGTAASAAPASARARSRRPRGDPIIPYLNTDFIYSAIAQELGLVGAAGAAARLHALRRARLPHRAARRRRLLEAARRRAHVRLRAADVHHRRRRPAA